MQCRNDQVSQGTICRGIILTPLRVELYTRYPIVARALGLAAARPSASASKGCMQDTFARATHSAGRPSAARDDRVSCIQEQRYLAYNVWSDSELVVKITSESVVNFQSQELDRSN